MLPLKVRRTATGNKMDRNRARILTQKSLDTIRRTFGRRRSRLVRQHLASKTAALDAAFRTLGAAASQIAAERLAERIRPFSPAWEAVPFRYVAKRSGGYRTICTLPNALFGCSLMIRDVLRAQMRAPQFIYNVCGRGRDQEARNIKAAIEAGNTWCYVADVQSCFDSIDPDALYSLPLPSSVVRNVLDVRSLQFVHRPEREEEIPPTRTMRTTHPRRGGPRGILQGSPASDIVLIWLLSDLADALPDGNRAFLLADDLLVACNTEDECRRIEHVLVARFREHRAGRLILVGEIYHAAGGFERAGYHFKQSELTGQVEIDMSNDNWDSLYRLLEADVDVPARYRNDRQRRLRMAFRPLIRIEEKFNGFSAATDAENSKRGLMEFVSDALRLPGGAR